MGTEITTELIPIIISIVIAMLFYFVGQSNGEKRVKLELYELTKEQRIKANDVANEINKLTDEQVKEEAQKYQRQ
jgi:uncharacterized protein YacL